MATDTSLGLAIKRKYSGILLLIFLIQQWYRKSNINSHRDTPKKALLLRVFFADKQSLKYEIKKNLLCSPKSLMKKCILTSLVQTQIQISPSIHESILIRDSDKISTQMRFPSENNLMFSFSPGSVIQENVRCDYKVMILIPPVTQENQPCHIYNSSYLHNLGPCHI